MTASTSAPRSRTKVFLLAILCATFVLLLPALSDSALAGLQKKGTIKPEEAYNPQPDKQHDIVLPMPDGLFMVFRVVAVPARGYLGDLVLKAGREGTDELAFYDRRYKTRISAPFSMNDVKEWSEKADLPEKRQYFFYLIAKYEVTQKQWRAIMGKKPEPTPAGATGSSPKKDEKIDQSDDARPITNISWFDAVEFTKRYTCWLLDEGKLPYLSGDDRHPAYVRLPTEVEWEYAARGGQNASRQSLEIDPFFKMEEGLNFPDYAVYLVKGSSHIADKPEKIGSRKPNPLGLYDTAGNVAEMTMDHFRFSAGGFLLGSAGGFVRKGGSFLSGEEEIMPGKREETPFFLNSGPQIQRDLGFRPVISGINTPGGGRLATLKDEYEHAGEQNQSSKERSLMARLAELIADPENMNIKSDLEKLQAELKDTNIRREKEQLATAMGNIQHCLTLLESIHNYDQRLSIIMAEFAMKFDKYKKELPNAKGKRKKLIEDMLKKAEQIKKDYISARKRTCEIYTAEIDDIVDDDREINKESMGILARDYEGNDFFNRSMRINLRVFKTHYAARIKGRKLTERDILADLEKATKGK